MRKPAKVNVTAVFLPFAIHYSPYEVSMEKTQPLSTIAHGRSGDKGNHANVAIIAYTEAGFAWLKRNLTAEKVSAYFAPLQPSKVDRFEAANLLAVNFVLHNVLAGGASRSLRIDTQGKTLALALLQMPVELPNDLTPLLRPSGTPS
jgi:hypothetical protein